MVRFCLNLDFAAGSLIESEELNTNMCLVLAGQGQGRQNAGITSSFSPRSRGEDYIPEMPKAFLGTRLEKSSANFSKRPLRPSQFSGLTGISPLKFRQFHRRADIAAAKFGLNILLVPAFCFLHGAIARIEASKFVSPRL